MKYATLLVVAAIVSRARCQLFDPVIRTNKGYVKGKPALTILNRLPYTEFLGIPFAKPPVGDLRFEDPVEADPWEGTLNAFNMPDACAQYIFAWPIGKEDCLYLNVYTPAIDRFGFLTELKPVMVWIYGGGFQGGFTYSFAFNPGIIVEQDVIIVSLNYRVGALGFLSLEVPGATGNQGLKDQVMALKWVQENIAAFGGDPNRVTLFGQSAGASCVAYHLMSPTSEGLFHKAILQSGSPLNPWAYKSPDQSLKVAFELASRIGIIAVTKEELLAALKQSNFMDITRATNSMSNILAPFQIAVPFVPTAERIVTNSTIVDDCPITKLQTGKFRKMPILMGSTHNEALLFGELIDQTREVLYDQTYKISVPGLRLLAGILGKFVSGITQGSTTTEAQVASIYFFSGPVDITRRYYALYNEDHPVYYYQLNYDSDYNFHKIFDPNWNGTSHCDDLSLLFHMFINSPTDPDASFNVFRKKFTAMWANFAKYGDPTPDESVIGIRWQPSGEEGLQLNIGYDVYEMKKHAMSRVDGIIERAYATSLPSSTACNELIWSPPSIF